MLLVTSAAAWWWVPCDAPVYQRLKEGGPDVPAVNPHDEEIDGDRCYADLRAIRGGSRRW